MLQPANRFTLIDALRPPAGFGVDSAMAVTFTLDLRALTAVPAAFALSGGESTDGDAARFESIELLHALRSNADKISVFCQAGYTAVPPSHRVFTFLEGSVVPVEAPRGGIVHPKVWVLRYTAGDTERGTRPEQSLLRVLVASRNLTFDASWDTMLRLDECHDGGIRLEPVGELFQGLLNAAVGTVDEVHRRRVESLATTLQTATFVPPDGVDDLVVHVVGLSEGRSPLPTTAQRSLIISPFVHDRFFDEIHPHRIEALVSRQESLDALSPQTLDQVGTAYTFDDGSVSDLGDIEDLEDRTDPHDPGRPLVGLHAKVFAFEEEGRARLFVGSANATGAAFRSNVEILVELIGPRSTLGIDQLVGVDDEERSDDESSLRDWFHRYVPPDEPVQLEDSSFLDGARRAIARLPIEGIVERSGNDWAVTYRSAERVPRFEGVEVHCWPLGSAGYRRAVAGGGPFEERFETSLEAMSGFLVFELTGDDGTRTEFILPMTLIGVPEERERVLMRALVGNAERFLAYLLAMLDDDPSQLGLPDAIESVGAASSTDGNPATGLPVLEKLLRTMRRDPAKLNGLHPLVSDLADDDALPDGFAELWEVVRGVMTADRKATSMGASQ
ncbi:MAG: phospholipase D family protein [Acidimicrobiaceae bacterium]|nr:phospholipase D family protein [Acidimicrobiaceae bacterium]